MDTPEEAEELVQETMIVAYGKLHDFHGGARFGTWIHGIARNLCRNRSRKRAELLSDDGVLEPAAPTTGMLRQLRRDERARILTDVSREALTAEEQEAVHMRYVLELPLPEIEQVLRLGRGQARVMLQRSKRRLGRALTRELERLGHGASLFDSQT